MPRDFSRAGFFPQEQGGTYRGLPQINWHESSTLPKPGNKREHAENYGAVDHSNKSWLNAIYLLLQGRVVRSRHKSLKTFQQSEQVSTDRKQEQHPPDWGSSPGEWKIMTVMSKNAFTSVRRTTTSSEVSSTSSFYRSQGLEFNHSLCIPVCSYFYTLEKLGK